MTYSIIGSGHVGTALAGHFARSGIPVGIANRRSPESLAALAEDTHGRVAPLSLQRAVDADVVILAVPFRAHTDVARLRSDWTGTTVIDAMNTYGVSPEELKGRASTDVVASAFPGAKVVKTFNQLPAKVLAQDPADSGGGRRVMFVASNDDDAQASVATLVGVLGFAPIGLGKIAAGGALIDMKGPLILQNLVKQG